MNSHTNSHKPKAIVLLLALLSATAFLSYSSWLPAAASAPGAVTVASHWSEQPQILARQRGNPWINVEDGREVITTFAGPAELKAAMETNQSHPLALATADFDEDGTPDIVAGYSGDQRGSGSFMRGNVDAVYGNSPEARERKAKGEFTDAPFLGPARLFALPLTPDFLAAGDFDADGRYDLVTAARTENAIYFLKGDGRGGFAFAKRIELAGTVTALLADDFNRRDGLNDLVVAVQTKQDAQLLIFEHPYGAMKAQPEIFSFAAPIRSLGFGSIEGDAHFDLAIAAGNELGILRGRDRKLLLDESGKQADAPKLTRRIFDFEIDSLAVGEFLKGKTFKAEIALLARDGKIHLLENGGTRNKAGNLSAVWGEKESISLPDNLSNDNAPILLTARVSARSVDTLVVGSGERIHLLTSDILPPRTKNEAINYAAQKFNLAASLDVAGAAVAILPMRLNVDALSDLVALRKNSASPAIVPTAPMASFVVNSNSNGVDCDGSDNVCAICPVISQICTLEAAFDQLQSAQGASSITFQNVSGPIVRGVYYGSFLPLTIDGTGNLNGFVETTGTGFDLVNDSHTVRGMVMNADDPNVSVRHIILENSGGSLVEGNRLGTNKDGDGVGQGSASGVEIVGDDTSNGNTIGGTAQVLDGTCLACNLISGTATGINISAPGSTGSKIQGNYIGTDLTGAYSLGNEDGINIDRTAVTIGGLEPGARNLVSGNSGNGMSILGALAAAIPSGIFMIQGNYIGTTETGLSSIGNGQRGIVFSTSYNESTIGGTTPAARNIISGNGTDGVFITTAGTGSILPLQQVLGNYIGTNAAGAAPIPNGGLGLYMDGNLPKVVKDNVISGNTGGGAHFNINDADASGNDTISNNFIGTDSTGTAPLGNNGIGLLFTIVNTSTVSGNVIAANTSHGISAVGGSSFVGGTGIIYEKNFIGTNSALSQTLGNGEDGIRLNGEFQSRIGGVNAGNTIAFNMGNGITLVNENSTQENRVFGNSIFSNGGLGIDLNDDGFSANDDCDIDPGQNGLQNYPVLATAAYNGGNFHIAGTLNSTAATTYTIDFYVSSLCDANGYGEGQTYLGSTTVTTSASCAVDFNATLPASAPMGQDVITATATDSIGNTSEFSQCILVTPPNTPAGSNIVVSTPTSDATVTFHDVSAAGTTFFTPITPNPAQVPAGYTLCPTCPAYDITTTASYTPPVYVCLIVPAAVTDAEYILLKLMHSENGMFVDHTTGRFIDGGARFVCGVVQSLSPFALASSAGPTAAPAGISGQITRADGTPLAGVLMQLGGTQSRKTITDANGNYHFDNVETNGFYTVTPSRANYTFNPSVRSFSQLGQTTEAAFSATPTSGAFVNPSDTAEYFVRQHYLDFLGREPDESGFNFWSDQILECGNDAACRERRTVNVSAAYFLSIEFQETGGLADGLYRASYGRRPHYSEFMPDSGTIARDVVVGRAGWAQQLEANKRAFIDAWVLRPAFQSAYEGLTNEGYVDALINHTGVSFDPGEREALVSGLNNGTSTRADTLRQVAENDRFVNAKRNAAFVMMQYFGYLRRDPDETGYQFWLDKLNQVDGNFEQAEMVKAFLVSGEYRGRFGH